MHFKVTVVLGATMLLASTAQAGTLSRAPGDPKVSVETISAQKFGFFAKHTQVFAGDIDGSTGRLQRRTIGTSDTKVGWELEDRVGPIDFNGEFAGLWTEDYEVSEEDSFGLGATFNVAYRGPLPLKLYGEYGPELSRDDGSNSETFSESFELGAAISHEFDWRDTTLSFTPSYVWDDSENDAKDGEGFNAELELETAGPWSTKFIISAAYAQKTFDLGEPGLIGDREDESFEGFVGFNIAPLLPKPLRIAKLTVGPTYVRQESNSLKPDQNYNRWQFAPTVKFVAPLN